MSEELIQRKLLDSPEKIGEWEFYNIGSTTLRSLKAAKIIPDRNYNKYETKKPDALIVLKQKVIAAIEYKTPQELNSKRKIATAIRQEICTARVLEANVYIVTDGVKSFWINPATENMISDENGDGISLVFDRDSRECVILLHKIIASINSKCDRIQEPKIVDPLPLAKKVWQDLWSVSGATPENCLYTFVEIFIFKYLSDLGVLSGIYSFANLLDAYRKNSEGEVLDLYAKNIRPKIKSLFPKCEKDSTTIINGTILVSKDETAVAGYSAVFKKILQRFEDFGPLSNIDRDFKSRLFETFLKESISKKNWGQYFTPLKVVRAMVDMADVCPGMSLCDPACGVGKFLLEPVAKNIDRYFEVKNGRLISHINLTGFDKGFDREEQKTIILAKANMLIYMAELLRDNPSATESFAEEFNRTFTLQTNSILGTLANPAVEQYDMILTNPPYVMSGSSNLKEEIAKSTRLKSYYAISAMGIEGLFMEWIVRALKPGGKAFVVVPDGIFNRANDQKLREFILRECCIDAIVSLPINTFFTTNKKTYILAITKKQPVIVRGVSTLPEQTDPVFTYLCSEIGESRDVYRFEIEQNDLKTATAAFNMFKGAKKAFRTNDRRCKIVSINQFTKDVHWCVDRWWTRQEKIALGIEEETRSITVGDFRGMLADVVSSLGELDELLAGVEKKNDASKKRIREFPVDSLFEVKRGRGVFIKRYVREHPGEYPVFSGNTSGSFATVDAFDFDEPCLSWVIDGLAGYMMVHERPFSATNHRGILIPKPKYRELNLRYMKYVMEPIFRDAKKGRLGDGGMNEYTSLPPNLVTHLKVPLVVDEDDNIDFAYQAECARSIEILDQVREEITQRSESFLDVNVVGFLKNYSFSKFKLHTLFLPQRGYSRYTKKFGNEHRGPYPVYSASSQTPLTRIDTYDYSGKHMTWSTNGFAGTILVIDGKFSLNGDRGILLPRDGRTDLDLDYMRYTLEPIFRSMAKGRKGDCGEDEFTKLYPTMLMDVEIPVPVRSDGTIDLDAQREIAGKYKTIEQCKHEICERCRKLIAQDVVL